MIAHFAIGALVCSLSSVSTIAEIRTSNVAPFEKMGVSTGSRPETVAQMP
jgi:hypothetical protein